jgi:hypothetical protein
MSEFTCCNVIDGSDCWNDATWNADIKSADPDLAGIKYTGSYCTECKRAGISRNVTAWRRIVPALVLEGGDVSADTFAPSKPAPSALKQASLFAMHHDAKPNKMARHAAPTLMDWLDANPSK